MAWRRSRTLLLDLEVKDVDDVERGSPPKIGTRRLFDTGLKPDPTVNQYAVTEDGVSSWCWTTQGFLETYSVFLTGPRP